MLSDISKVMQSQLDGDIVMRPMPAAYCKRIIRILSE